MIGYAFLCLIAFFTITLGLIVCGVAVWGWKQQKKAALAKLAGDLTSTISENS